MNSKLSASEKKNLKTARRITVWAIVVSLVITAAIGIYTVVTGNGDETQLKIMITTLSIAGFSVLALCHLAIMGRDLRAVGWAGIVASVISLIASLFLIWWNYGDYSTPPTDFYEFLNKSFTISLLIAVSLAQTNLMLLIANAPKAWIRISLNVHLVIIALVVAMVLPIILTNGEFPPASFSDIYFRLFGVVLILDALATVALPVSTLVLRGHQTEKPKQAASPTGITVSINGVNTKWLEAESKSSGKSVDAILNTIVAAARKG